MKIEDLDLEGLKVIHLDAFEDERGFFLESYQKERCQKLGFSDFVQDNTVFSKKNVLRGLHFQEGQDKLVYVLQGKIMDIAVDIRKDSKTYKKYVSLVLDGHRHQQFFIPSGFAHGYFVISEFALVQYKVSSFYDPKKGRGFRWNDPEVNIQWPSLYPLLSRRDKESPFLKEIDL